MKIPNIFVPEKDLTNKVNKYTEGREVNPQPASLYDHIKRLYEGLGSQNMFLIYGPTGTGKTVMSEKTKKELSDEYNVFYVKIWPMGSTLEDSMLEYRRFFKDLENKICKALSENKKIYVDIEGTERFYIPAFEELKNILEDYKSNRNVAFILQYTSNLISEEREVALQELKADAELFPTKRL